MITILSVNTLRDDVRVMRAIKENRNDNKQYQVELSPNQNNLNGEDSVEFLLCPEMDSPNLISFTFNIKRGLYDAIVTEVKEITDPNCVIIIPETAYKYPVPVMIGQKYIVKAKIEDSMCYGERGVRVRAKCVEADMSLSSNIIYYIIRKENISHIKYYIPFNNLSSIDFFVKGVSKENIEIYVDNPSIQIEKY